MDYTRKMLQTIRESIEKNNKIKPLVNEDNFEKDNLLRRAEILMEEAEQNIQKKTLNEDVYSSDDDDESQKKDFVIKSSDPQFSNLRSSQEEALRKTIGDVELKDDALIYHPSIDDITLDFIAKGINCKVQYRLSDPSGCGVYLTAADLQLTEDNAKTINKIRSAFLNWKDSITSDGTTLKDIEKAAERDRSENGDNNQDVNESIQETSRRQKAVQSIIGKNHRVKTIAILSAENPMGMVASPEENAKNREDLLHTLQIGGYQYFKTNGKYGDDERSIQIYNISLKDALFLGQKYNQESIIFVDTNTNDGDVSYQYWERPDSNSPYEKTKEEHEIVNASDDDDYRTAISRKFKYRIPFNFDEQYVRVLTKLSEKDKKYNVDKLISESIDDRYTGKHKYFNRLKLYR